MLGRKGLFLLLIHVRLENLNLLTSTELTRFLGSLLLALTSELTSSY